MRSAFDHFSKRQMPKLRIEREMRKHLKWYWRNYDASGRRFTCSRLDGMDCAIFTRFAGFVALNFFGDGAGSSTLGASRRRLLGGSMTGKIDDRQSWIQGGDADGDATQAGYGRYGRNH